MGAVSKGTPCHVHVLLWRYSLLAGGLRSGTRRHQPYVATANTIQAEMCLVNAWSTCHKNSTKNRELILTYLIPCRLITKSLIPSDQVLQEFPHLRALFGDLVRSIKTGDLAGFDKAFAEGEPEFVRRRVFLTLERSRDIALRNLLRKVFLAAGFEDLKEGQTEKDRIRKTRIPLAHFVAAVRMGSGGGQVVDDEEVECLLANMIYKVRSTRSEALHTFARFATSAVSSRLTLTH